MKFNKNLLSSSIAFGLLLTGCTSTVGVRDPIFELNQPNRVIYHDFTNKYDLAGSIPQISSAESVGASVRDKAVLKPASYRQDAQPIAPKKKESREELTFVDVEFYNESAIVKNPKSTTANILEVIGKRKILIVGHSHGQSAIGVESLASQRARYLADLLFLQGVAREDMFFMSSWSDGGRPYDMSRGVRVIGLSDDIGAEQALLTGLIQNRSKTNET